MNRFVSLSMIATLFTLSTSAQANLLANASFEAPIVPMGSFLLFPPNSLPDWNVFVPAPGTDVGVVSSTFTQNGVTFPAQDGNQWLDLTGLGSNSSEGVSQTVATTAGHLYSLSYYIGNTNGGDIFGTQSTVNVLLDGVAVFTDINSNQSATALVWQQFAHTFVAAGASTILGFQNADPVSDNSNGLDNIVLLDLGPSAAVSEPHTLALLSMVFVGLGILVNRKRQ